MSEKQRVYIVFEGDHEERAIRHIFGSEDAVRAWLNRPLTIEQRPRPDDFSRMWGDTIWVALETDGERFAWAPDERRLRAILAWYLDPTEVYVWEIDGSFVGFLESPDEESE